MPLVQSPGLDDRDVVTIEFISGVVKGLDGPGQDRSVADIELEAVLLESLAGLDCLLDTWS